MSLPRPPVSANTPIPNQPFSAPEVYYLEGNQGHLPLGPGLYIDPSTGSFTDIDPSPYIYCTPQFSHLPITYPPYGCNTEVNTEGVADFTDAWRECDTIINFPCVDTSSATDLSSCWAQCYYMVSIPPLNTSNVLEFKYAFNYCYDLANFPLIDTSKCTSFEWTWASCYNLANVPELNTSNSLNFERTWAYCESLTSFPTLDLSKGENFTACWFGCSGLVSFPPLNVGSGLNFSTTWRNCTSLTNFPAGMFDSCSATDFVNAWLNCALSQQSVDNILVSLDTAGQSNGTVSIDGGTSSAPGPAGLAAKASLEAKGWTVLTN